MKLVLWFLAADFAVLVLLLGWWSRAPEGFEDEDGFHFIGLHPDRDVDGKSARWAGIPTAKISAATDARRN
jgi:hypothetical protein